MSLLSTSRVLSPLLTSGEKHAWARSLRLTELSFCWIERTTQEVLRASRLSRGEVRPTLEHPESGPRWVQTRSREIPILPPRVPSLGVWESLLPHPLNLLPVVMGKGLEIFPPEERTRWVDLYEAFLGWEALFKETEFSCVAVEGSAAAPSVLFHFVQGKCRACGSARHLDSLFERHRAGQLAPNDLLQYFGGQASLHCLEVLPPTQAPDPLAALTQLFQRAAQGHGNKIEFRFRGLAQADLELSLPTLPGSSES